MKIIKGKITSEIDFANRQNIVDELPTVRRRLLRELYWTPQVPIRRAIQRDEPAIAQKRARSDRRVLVFEDESGFCLLPGVLRTYALRAHTAEQVACERLFSC